MAVPCTDGAADACAHGVANDRTIPCADKAADARADGVADIKTNHGAVVLADIDAVAVIEAYVVADGITHARPLASANDQPGANGTSHLVSNFGTVRWTDAAAFEQSDACAHGVADERTISCADKATVA